MKGRVVLISYLIVAASAASIWLPPLLAPYNYYPYYFGGLLSLFFPAYVLAVAGMVLGPYFGLAGLIAKNRSVWVEVNRMLHTHISVPIVGGLAMFYGSLFGYVLIFFLLPVYGLFVFLATLITVMAARASKDPAILTPVNIANPA